MLFRHPIFRIAVPEPAGIVFVQSANMKSPQTWLHEDNRLFIRVGGVYGFQYLHGIDFVVAYKK